MVKFAKHNAAQQRRLPSSFYLVSYSSLKNLAEKNALTASKVTNLYEFERENLIAKERSDFVDEWRTACTSHRAWISSETHSLFQTIINALSSASVDFRGADLEDALKQFTLISSNPAATLRLLKNLRVASTENVESLRKAIKKYDKLNPKHPIGDELLPELYVTVITSGPDTLKKAVRAVETQLSLTSLTVGDLKVIEERQNSDAHPLSDDDESESTDNNSHSRRRDELMFLQTVSSQLASLEILSKLVVHRGFHSVDDRSSRPIENSLNSFETAWTSGLSLCECDVALTVDGFIVLCHDKTFERLALFAKETKPVTDMTLRELMGLQLRTGARPPLLADVLDSALNIGSLSQMVVEIKPGNSEMGSALCKLFLRRPELIGAVGVVMSFDLFIMHDFVKLFNEIALSPDTPRPMMLLLTVSELDSPDNENCCWLSVDKPLPNINDWLVRPDSALDGLYVQFEDSMVESGAGLESFKALCKSLDTVGVWGHTKKYPDRVATAQTLIGLGAANVNTDLPREYCE